MAQVELLSAMAYDEALSADGLVDPVVVVRGELPGAARPFVVERIYRAPQGVYDESFVILGPDGAVVYEHPYARVELRGEMFEDRFVDVVRSDVKITDADDHTLVLLIGEVPVGRVPVFIDAPESARAAGVVGDALAAALKKSSVVWLTIPQPGGGSITRPAWFVYQGGKVFVLTGPGEQQLTNLPDADEVVLTARSKDLRSRVAEVRASVRVVPNDSDEFDQIVELGLRARLNLPDGDAARERWKSQCVMAELTPEVS